ncbi:ROK family transcriptional regulator [Sunxiuqinia elliptica]
MVQLKKEDTEKMAISELKRYKLRMQILLNLYKKHPQSASALSKKNHVSLPTVRSILDELINEGVVQVAGIGDSQGGRRPILYCHADNAYCIMAVEIGHYKAKAVILNSLNKELTSIIEYTTDIDDPNLENKTNEVFQTLLQEAGISKDKVIATGISMPGLIDSKKGVNRTIKNANQQNVQKRLVSVLQMPVIIENDARMQALGEFVFGKAKKTKNTLVINWSWGLGLGMILNGQIYHGSSGTAGEFSHIRMIPNGKLCECGKQGCLQTIASARPLIDMAQQQIKEGAISQLTSRFAKKPEEVTVKDIINCAKKGDELSISLLNEISKKFGWGLSILIQLYNPELIVLNGPLAEAQQYVLVPIQQSINQYCLENIQNNVKIEISEIGEQFGLKGVAVMVFHRIFRDKSIDISL